MHLIFCSAGETFQEDERNSKMAQNCAVPSRGHDDPSSLCSEIRVTLPSDSYFRPKRQESVQRTRTLHIPTTTLPI